MFSKSKTPRFAVPRFNTPGPGSYDLCPLSVQSAKCITGGAEHDVCRLKCAQLLQTAREEYAKAHELAMEATTLQLKQAVAAQDAVIGELEAKLRQVTTDKDSVQRALENTSNTAEEAITALATFRAAISSNQATIVKVEGLLREATTQRDELSKKLADVETALAASEAALTLQQQVSADGSELQRTCEQLQQQMAVMQREHAELLEQVRVECRQKELRAAAWLQAARADFVEQLTAAEVMIKAIQANHGEVVSSLQAQIAELKEKNLTDAAQLAEYQQAASKWEEQYKQLLEQVNREAETHNRVVGENASLVRSVKSLEQTVSNLQAELATAQQALLNAEATYQQELAQNAAAAETATAHADALQSDVTRLMDEAALARRYAEQVQQQLHAKLDAAQSKLAAVCLEHQQESKALRATVAVSEQTISELTGVVRKLQGDLSTAHAATQVAQQHASSSAEEAEAAKLEAQRSAVAFADVQQHLREALDTVTELHEERNAVASQLDVVTLQANSSAAQAADLRVQLDGALQAQREAEYQSRLLKAQLQQAQDAHAADKRMFAESHTALRSTITALEGRLAQSEQALVQQASELEAQIAEQRRSQDQLRKNLQDELAIADAARRRLQTEAQAGELTIAQLKQQAVELQEQLAGAKREAADSATALQTLLAETPVSTEFTPQQWALVSEAVGTPLSSFEDLCKLGADAALSRGHGQHMYSKYLTSLKLHIAELSRRNAEMTRAQAGHHRASIGRIFQDVGNNAQAATAPAPTAAASKDRDAPSKRRRLGVASGDAENQVVSVKPTVTVRRST